MLKKIETVTSALAAAALFMLMMFTFLDVVGRNVFNRPMPGASELTEILLALGVFLMLPAIAWRQEHIVVDLIDSFRGKFLIWSEKILVAGLGGGLFALIGWRLWVLAGKSAGYGDATPTLQLPLAPVLYGMAVLSILTALSCLLVLWLEPVDPAASSAATEADAAAEPSLEPGPTLAANTSPALQQT